MNLNEQELLSSLLCIRTQVSTLIAALEATPSQDEEAVIKAACLKVGLPAKASALAAEYQKVLPHLSMRRAARLMRAMGMRSRRSAQARMWFKP